MLTQVGFLHHTTHAEVVTGPGGEIIENRIIAPEEFIFHDRI